MISNRTYGIDPDVIAYNARIVTAGNQSLSMQSIKDLNQFVISLKKMNLWASMVCWPLRSIYNAGTGITAYSLGGLGVYNGTLTGGPLWGINGIETTSTSYISTNDLFRSTSILISVYRKTTTSANGAICAAYVSGPERGYELRHDGSNNPQARFYSTAGVNNARTSSVNCNDGRFHFLAGITDDSSAMVFVDGVAGSFSSITGPRSVSTNNFTIGRRAASNAELVPIESSFVCIFTSYSNSIFSIYSLCKSTLGQGLNLP